MQPEHMCGITCWHPTWLQKFANTKSFLLVYGLLGTIQSMAFLYFVVTLTTVEKRFKIPSYTTGECASFECRPVARIVRLAVDSGARILSQTAGIQSDCVCVKWFAQ